MIQRLKQSVHADISDAQTELNPTANHGKVPVLN
jgi:hypothetical protein